YEVQDDAEDLRIAHHEGRRAMRHRFGQERRRLRADIRRQRAELQATIAAADAQELAEQARIKAEIAAAQAELARYEADAEDGGADEKSQETMRRLSDRKESMAAQVTDLRGRIRLGRRRLRGHRRADRAAERVWWRELRRRVRAQRPEPRLSMQSARDRLARPQVTDLRGRIRLGRRRLRDHRRADRAAERELWRELRRRVRAQRRETRLSMRSERERLARAEDSDLQGSE